MIENPTLSWFDRTEKKCIKCGSLIKQATRIQLYCHTCKKIRLEERKQNYLIKRKQKSLPL